MRQEAFAGDRVIGMEMHESLIRVRGEIAIRNRAANVQRKIVVERPEHYVIVFALALILYVHPLKRDQNASVLVGVYARVIVEEIRICRWKARQCEYARNCASERVIETLTLGDN
jgi:hypothetical protein